MNLNSIIAVFMALALTAIVKADDCNDAMHACNAENPEAYIGCGIVGAWCKFKKHF